MLSQSVFFAGLSHFLVLSLHSRFSLYPTLISTFVCQQTVFRTHLQRFQFIVSLEVFMVLIPWEVFHKDANPFCSSVSFQGSFLTPQDLFSWREQENNGYRRRVPSSGENGKRMGRLTMVNMNFFCFTIFPWDLVLAPHFKKKKSAF